MNKVKEFFKNKWKIKEYWERLKSKRAEKKSLKVESDDMLNLSMKIKNHRKGQLIKWGTVVGVIAVLVIGYSIYNYVRVFHNYSMVSSAERADIAATQYAQLDGNLIKYSPDGVTCVSGANEVLWSTTFSMQSPIIDICETTVVVGDQKGTQVYIFDEKGLLGQFQTLLPILKVKVASQGVVAAILEDGDVTWINYYDMKGNPISKNRTSIGESGYPLDMDLSPDGLKMMVSYLGVTQGKISSKIAFYNFDSIGQAQVDNMVSSVNYDNTVVPKTLFVDESTSVAVRDNGFTIFKGKQIPEESATVEIEEEIISLFHNEKYLGVVLKSDKPEYSYKMRLYNMNGSKTMEQDFNLDYKQIKIDGDQIIIFNEGNFAIYSIGGKEKFSGSYEKPIVNIISTSGFRKYTVITQNSTDQIRLK